MKKQEKAELIIDSILTMIDLKTQLIEKDKQITSLKVENERLKKQVERLSSLDTMEPIFRNSQKRFDELAANYTFEWHSFFHGWTEGRFDLVSFLKGLEAAQLNSAEPLDEI